MKKKFIIIGAIVVAVIAIALACFFLFCNKKITVSFDANGAKAVEAIKIKKGESVNLPEIEKDGYIFVGWFLDGKIVSNSTTYDEDVTLKAEWISADADTFTVTFNSNGGSKVNDLVVECGKTLALPVNPTRSGYTFVSWVGKNGTQILDKALLPCEDITLKANWKKEEAKQTESKTEDKKEETKEPEKTEVTYTCPDGFTLNGKTCTKTESIAADKSCARGTVSGTSCIRELADQDPVWPSCSRDCTLTSDYTSDGRRKCYCKHKQNEYISPTCSGREYSYDVTSHMCKANGAYTYGKVTYSCTDSSYTLDGDKCTKTITVDATEETN